MCDNAMSFPDDHSRGKAAMGLSLLTYGVDRFGGVWYYTRHEIHKCRYFAGGGEYGRFPARSKAALKFVIQSPMSKVLLSSLDFGHWTLDIGMALIGQEE